MGKLVEVRVRNEYATEAAHLTDWPLDDLDGLMHRVKRWGMVDEDGEENSDEMTGQFTYKGGAAYFELILPVTTED